MTHADFDTYRQLIAAMAPDLAGRIIVHRGDAQDGNAIYQNIVEQTDPEILAGYDDVAIATYAAMAVLELRKIVQEGMLRPHTLSIPQPDRDIDIDLDALEDIDGIDCRYGLCYIVPHQGDDITGFIKDMCAESGADFAASFNTAAIDADTCKWFVFGHELGHAFEALTATHRPAVSMNPIAELHYSGQMESICDGVGTLVALAMRGDAARPSLEMIADMRLCAFPVLGFDYHTEPVIRTILRMGEEGALPEGKTAHDFFHLAQFLSVATYPSVAELESEVDHDMLIALRDQGEDVNFIPALPTRLIRDPEHALRKEAIIARAKTTILAAAAQKPSP